MAHSHLGVFSFFSFVREVNTYTFVQRQGSSACNGCTLLVLFSSLPSTGASRAASDGKSRNYMLQEIPILISLV